MPLWYRSKSPSRFAHLVLQGIVYALVLASATLLEHDVRFIRYSLRVVYFLLHHFTRIIPTSHPLADWFISGRLWLGSPFTPPMMRLLAFVFFASISSVVTALVRGTHRITNVKTRTTLRNFDIGQPIFIGNNTLEVPRQFDQVSSIR